MRAAGFQTPSVFGVPVLVDRNLLEAMERQNLHMYIIETCNDRQCNKYTIRLGKGSSHEQGCFACNTFLGEIATVPSIS